MWTQSGSFFLLSRWSECKHSRTCVFQLLAAYINTPLTQVWGLSLPGLVFLCLLSYNLEHRKQSFQGEMKLKQQEFIAPQTIKDQHVWRYCIWRYNPFFFLWIHYQVLSSQACFIFRCWSCSLSKKKKKNHDQSTSKASHWVCNGGWEIITTTFMGISHFQELEAEKVSFLTSSC